MTLVNPRVFTADLQGNPPGELLGLLDARTAAAIAAALQGVNVPSPGSIGADPAGAAAAAQAAAIAAAAADATAKIPTAATLSGATTVGRNLLIAPDAGTARTAIGAEVAGAGSTAAAAAVTAAATDASTKATAAQTAAATDATNKVLAGYAALARTPDSLIAGAVTRDGNGAATSAPVVWPNGTPGLYSALVVSTAFPGAVDSYKITYGSPTVLKTYTQPTITRDTTTGAATVVPAITVA